MENKEFKIRCSAIGKIMGGTVGMSEAQKNKLDELNERATEALTNPKKALTENMKQLQAELLTLSLKKPELPQGAKTYVENWYNYHKYNDESEVYSKYLEKGKNMELEALEVVADRFNLGFLAKNEQRFSCEFMDGEPDALITKAVFDTKCSYDSKTFKDVVDCGELNSDYEWQMQGYLHLTGRKIGFVCYVLLNTEKYDLEVISYDHIPIEERYFHFRVDYDPNRIKQIEERVRMCREYLNEYISKEKQKFSSLKFEI